jgi:hypothetical protein
MGGMRRLMRHGLTIRQILESWHAGTSSGPSNKVHPVKTTLPVDSKLTQASVSSAQELDETPTA